MDLNRVKHILEACLLVAGREMSVQQLEALFDGDEDVGSPDRDGIREALAALQQEYEGRGIELVEVASGWRLQSRAELEPWVSRLFQEKSPRYSRALLETLVLIAYRQPITRGEIEEVRGVAVSSNIIKTLHERAWVREVGHKDVPGKPALLGTTRQFLDYFNLKRLEDLPSLGELKDLDQIDSVLAGELGLVDSVGDETAANDSSGVDTNGDGDLATGVVESGRDEQPSDEADENVAGEAETGEVETSEAGAGEAETREVEMGEVETGEAEAGEAETGGIEADEIEAGEAEAGQKPGDTIAGDKHPLAELAIDDAAVSVDLEEYRAEVGIDDEPAAADFASEEPLAEELAAEELAAEESETQMPTCDHSGSAPDDNNGTSSQEDPQARLRRVIDDFAAEHREDLDAVGASPGESDGRAEERTVELEAEAVEPEGTEGIP